MDLTIIVPVKKGELHIEACLTSLAASKEVELEIFVILDGWDSLSFRENCHQIHPNLRIFSIPKSSPATCRNFGAQHSKSEFICFIDSDVLVTESLFSRAIHRLKTSGDHGLIGSYDTDPGSKLPISRFRNVFHHYQHQINNGKTGVFWGAFGMIRRDAFEKTGGFDESFSKPSIEDIELGIRMAKHGFRVSIHADLQVKHLKEWTFYSWMKTDILLRAKPWTKLIFSHKSHADNHLNTRREEKISAVLVILLWISIGGLTVTFHFWPFILVFGLLFIIFQRKFYAFAFENFKNIIAIFFLHQLYFLFAMIGFALGWIALLWESTPQFNQPVKS